MALLFQFSKGNGIVIGYDVNTIHVYIKEYTFMLHVIFGDQIA